MATVPDLWTVFTTFITATSLNPTTGSDAVMNSAYLQINNILFIQMRFSQSQLGLAGLGSYLFNLPSGFTVNTTIAPTGACLGSANATTGTSAYASGDASVYDSTHYTLGMGTGGTSYIVGALYYSLLNLNLTYSANLIIPINTP
jgi:hypothetical protein